MKKRYGILGIVALFAIGATAWLYLGRSGELERAASPGRSQKTLAIGYFSRAIGYAPYFVAQEKGWFGENRVLQGWKITHTIYGSRATIADAFDSGDLDVLLSAEIPAIMCRAQGNDIRIVAVTGLITLPWIARADLHAGGMAELEGHRVAYQAGTSSHYGLLTTLARASLKESDFDLRNMQATEAKSAFESGRIDAWVVWSPFLEQQVVSGAGTPVPGSTYNYTTTMAVSNDLITQDPEVVHALIDVLDRAKKWIPQHRGEAEEIVAKATRQPVEVARAALDHVDFSARLTNDVVDMFQGMAQFLADKQVTRGDVVVNIRKSMLAPEFGDAAGGDLVKQQKQGSR